MNDLGQEVWRNGHNQFIFHHTAVTALGKARNRQTGFTTSKGLALAISTGRFTDAAKGKLLLTCPLQAVDEQNNLRWRCVDKANIRRSEAATNQRAYRHGLIMAEGHHIHGCLMRGGVFSGAKLNPVHAVPRKPFPTARMQAYNGAALGSNQVLCSNAYSPAIARCLADNLVSGVNVLGSSNPSYLLHFFAFGK